MPTGYTAGILDGKITTFEQFAKACMRAFGAAMHLRDEPLDGEYTPRVPSDYYAKEIEKSKQLLKDAELLSDEVIVETKRTQLESSKEYYINAIEKAKQGSIAMNDMLESIRNWQPPTEEHMGIKDFMLNQITQTIDFDCKTSYHDEALVQIESELQTLNASDIRKQMIEKGKKDLKYNTAEYKKDIDRCNESNKWVADFVASLK
jgi:hypothetical protein